MLFPSTRERENALSCEDTDYLGISHQLFKRQNTALPPPFCDKSAFQGWEVERHTLPSAEESIQAKLASLVLQWLILLVVAV